VNRDWRSDSLDDFNKIIVNPGRPVKVDSNPTIYPLVGKGLQGAVFRISDERCVKIYSRKKYCLRERKVFKSISGRTTIVPKVYDYGQNYLVMEYLSGPSLEYYLKAEGTISLEVTKQMIYLLKELERLNIPRIDFSLRHCIFDANGNLKLIDLVNTFRVHRAVPKRLIIDLKESGLFTVFVENVMNLDPKLAERWKL
jgi:serine/threonine protein kinase